MRMLLQVLGLIAVTSFIVGARLPQCYLDRLAVDETSNTVITCDQFHTQNTVTWYLKAQSPQNNVLLGECLPQPPCNQASRYSLTRSLTQSTVTITPSFDLRTIGSYRIRCDASGETSCALDVFYPAVVPIQNYRVEAKSGSWTFDGSCNITKTFSSSNNYECQVFRGTSQSSQTTSMKTVSYTPRPHSNASYRTGNCSFSSDFTSLLSGITSRRDFYFRIDVYPGPTRLVKGPVTLERPESPTISCPDIVAENTTFTCTCSTTNLGQPAGRLVWSRVSGGTIIEGEYDVTTLTLPSQTLTRKDQGVNKFRCDVRWAAGSYMAVYTGIIGFPPSQTVLKVKSATPSQTVTVSENDDVYLTCTATGGNPESTLTLSNATSTITTGSSPLIHSLGKAQCQHSSDYTCTANNGYGDSVTSSTRLYVNCKPRIAETDRTLELNYRHQSHSGYIDVIAYPPLNASFNSFKYLGPNGTDPASDTSNIRLTTNCQPKPDILYISTCTLSVQSVTSPTAAGFYTLTLNNTWGSNDVTFKVFYNAPVPASDNAAPTGNGAAIGGSVAAVIVVVAIVVVIVVFVMKRRKGHPKERLKSSTNAADSTRNGQGMEESGLAGGDQEATSRPLSFAPMAVYAEVDRKKKKSQAAAAPEAEANGGKPADVYAEVNKSKKSNQGAADQDAETSGGQPADVYADVDKTKTKQALGAGAKPKTGAKAAGKPKKEKKKKDKRDESAHVYGNVEEIKQGKGAKAKKTTTPPKEETSSGKMVTPEGLIYTAVEFSQPPKAGKPATKKPEEAVVYSAVDFKKSPPAP